MQQLRTELDPAAVAGMDMAYSFVNDPVAAIAFYRDVLGLNPTDIDAEGRGAEFSLPDGSTFGVWRDKDTLAPGGGVMFAVGDIDQAVARLRGRGLALADPIETPVCFMAFAADPDGNPLMIHERKR